MSAASGAKVITAPGFRIAQEYSCEPACSLSATLLLLPPPPLPVFPLVSSPNTPKMLKSVIFANTAFAAVETPYGPLVNPLFAQLGGFLQMRRDDSSAPATADNSASV